MLSSLCPGAIFPTTGLNRKSTPTPRTITPSELEYRYRRESADGTEWPHDSPVSRAYDVSNSSTSLIILNNKYGKNSTRLRGYYTGPSSSERFIDPNRHRGKSPRNPDHHYRCLDSSSPKFEPSINTGLDWTSGIQRPPSSLIDKTSVNPRRHQSCRATRISMSPSTSERPRSRISLPPQKYFTDFSDMTVGETLYMWSIEKIYNVENLKQLKQEQYRNLLKLEAKKGHQGNTDYAKYMRYINNAPNRTYGTGTGTPRAKSAVSYRSTSGEPSPSKGTESRAEHRTGKEDIQGKPSDSETQKQPQTSVQVARQEDKKDTKPVKQEKSEPAKPTEEKSTKGQGSRSPGRSSKTSQQKLGSMRSLRSKSSSRPSSTTSSVRSVQSNSQKTDHKEGRDRPKSRIGRIPDEGSSKSKEVEEIKNNRLETPKKQNEKTDNLSSSSSRSSLDEKNKMGSSSTSLSSKKSHSSIEKAKEPVKTSTSDNKEANDVKVHRIPSAVDLKEDVDNDDNDDNAGDDVNHDNATHQTELANADEKLPKEPEKSVKFSDLKSDTVNKTDEDKHITTDEMETVNKSDDAKETKYPMTDDNKQENNKNKLNRQDSFDDDDDRRANRDLDKIEY